MPEPKTPLYSLQYTLEDADFDHVYDVYLKTERSEEKKIAVVCAILIGIATVIALIFMSARINVLICGGIALACAFSYLFIPTNKKFIKQYQTLYGSDHVLRIYPDCLEIEEQQDNEDIFEEEATPEMEAEEDDGAVNQLGMKNLYVFETSRMFLLYKVRIHDFFEPLPKAMFSQEECEELRRYFSERLGKHYRTLENL